MTDKGQPAAEGLDNIFTCDSDGNRYALCGHAKRTLIAWADTRAREARLDELVNLKQNPDRIAPSDLSVWVDSVIEVVTVEDIDERLAELRTPEQEGAAS